MKYPVFSAFLLLVASFIISCQPRTAVKTESVSAPDSVFYFEQADLSDPFLDTIFQKPDQTMALNKRLYPPASTPAIPPRFKEIEGFRVQVFAATDSVNARSTRNELMSMVEDSVHFFPEKGLYKIQVGDYQWRYQADAMKTQMRQNGYPGAWVIQRMIIIPAATADTTITPIEQMTQSEPQDSGKYKIQVIVTGSRTRADEIMQQMRTQIESPVFSEQSGNLYKVFVGPFTDEAEARAQLARVRSLGYSDAWLVY